MRLRGTRLFSQRAAATAAWGVACVMVLGVAGPHLLWPSHPQNLVRGWDLAQFVAASRLVLEGEGARLYDQAAQYRARVALVGAESGIVYPPGNAFISPPLTALAYVPLALLPFSVAEPLHRVLSWTALAGAMFLVRRWLPVPWPVAAVLSLASPWNISTTQTGQNVSFVVLAWAGAARLLESGRTGAAAVTLVLAAALKPQLAALGLLLLLGAGAWMSVPGSGIISYLVSATVSADPLWPVVWIRSGLEIAGGEGGGYGWQNVAVVMASAWAWLALPERWRAWGLVAVAPVGALAMVPYPFHYYYLVGLLPFWTQLWWLLRWARQATDRKRKPGRASTNQLSDAENREPGL